MGHSFPLTLIIGKYNISFATSAKRFARMCICTYMYVYIRVRGVVLGGLLSPCKSTLA